MNDTPQYMVTAATFMADLQQALALTDIRATYRELGRILRLVADQQTSFAALHLNSLYAKVDYLAREHHIDAVLMHGVHDARVRVRRLLSYSDEELLECRLYDCRSIAHFVSILYQEPIPPALAALFPAEGRRKAVDSDIVADYFRLYLTRWDDQYLYGRCEELPDVEEVKVGYYFRSQSLMGNWSHLRPLLYPEAQLNVVRPRLYNGIYYPELLILDPDYLVDITQICGCIKEYGISPEQHLINQLSPNEDTVHTMLGSLAGQLLDEEVHSGTNPKPYDQSYAEFVRSNTFKALTTDIATLREDGAAQQQNIRRALREGLAQQVGRYDAQQVMLEPSFFSEMLGLQGRMDMLQLDYKVLLEQKSGKGAFVPGLPASAPPRQKEEHYTQVLLYQAILNYNFGIPNREIQTLLLYSKFANGLIGVSAAPQLLYQAIILRNQMAAQARRCCYDGFRKLATLQPEQLCQRPMNAKFLNTYVLPQLHEVLDPIQQASPLEQAYFYRFLSFITLEHTLSKVGNETKENSGFAAKWHDSLEEKYMAGNIYDQLTLIAPGPQHEGQVERLVFCFSPERASEMSNFRPGDIVIAYAYPVGTEPDARRTMVFRGNVKDITASQLTMELRAPQSHSHVFLRYDVEHYVWAVEHDFMESSSRSQYAGMLAFLQAPKTRRELLLFGREPRVDTSKQLRGEYGPFNELALRVRQAEDFFLIIGPPGTGKTSYGMLNTLQEQLLEPDTNVLITSFTNRAVDEICSKLVEQQIPFVRIGSTNSCSPEYRTYLLDEQLRQCTQLSQMHRLIETIRVFVGTTTSISGHTALFALKQFDLAIIDEASQILEPHLMPLLSARHQQEPAIRRFVMIGDHKQLPAVVQQRPSESAVHEPMLQAIGLTDCRLSLFERLLHRYQDDPRVVYMLRRQGRMHQDIADFPNQAFYQGRLQVVPLEHQTELLPAAIESNNGIDCLLATRRIAFIAAPLPDPILSDKVNQIEAQMIAATAVRIYLLHERDFDVNMTIGIIVPYRNQISTVRNAIDAYGYAPLHDITIDTVERYQGSQRDYILYGFTVQRPYQLNFLTNNTFVEDGCVIDRKLNVAMTRARRHLLLFGNPSVLAENELFVGLMQYVQQRDGYFEVEADKYVKGAF